MQRLTESLNRQPIQTQGHWSEPQGNDHKKVLFIQGLDGGLAFLTSPIEFSSVLAYSVMWKRSQYHIIV